MTRKLKPATERDAARINRALYDLRMVRDDLKKAGATQAVVAVRHAIKSTEGALRHVVRRIGPLTVTQAMIDVMRQGVGVDIDLTKISKKLTVVLQQSDFGSIVSKDYP